MQDPDEVTEETHQQQDYDEDTVRGKTVAHLIDALDHVITERVQLEVAILPITFEESM